MICKYMDWKGSATMLTSIQSAGVAPEMNLRITGKKALKGSTLALKPRADFNRSPKQGYEKLLPSPTPTIKELCPRNFLSKIKLWFQANGVIVVPDCFLGTRQDSCINPRRTSLSTLPKTHGGTTWDANCKHFKHGSAAPGMSQKIPDFDT